MNNSPFAGIPSPSDQPRYWYDDSRGELVYENGARIARPPNMPREWLRAVAPRQFYDSSSPRTVSSYPDYNSLQPVTPNPTGTYVQAGGPIELTHQTSHGSTTLVDNPYGRYTYCTPSMPNYSPDQITRNFQRSMTLDYPPRVPSYHPTVARMRRTSQGAGVMQMYDTTQALQPLREAEPQAESTLNPNFKRPAKSKKFFVTGKVFLTLWAEPAGDVNDSSNTVITEGISTGSFGELVFSKIRRFVVVREGDQACTALPIITYGRQGVSKKGVNKSEHAIIYTGKHAPSPLSQESPKRGEAGMLPDAIRVDPDEPQMKLDQLSRLDFAKVYTIEHNVKVRSLGKVNRASMRSLQYQFKTVWSQYFGDPGAGMLSTTEPSPSTLRVEASTSSCSKPELLAAFNALRACGLTAEEARAPLVNAGFDLSDAEFYNQISNAEDENDKSSALELDEDIGGKSNNGVSEA